MPEHKHIIDWAPGFDCLEFECRRDKGDCSPGAGGSHGRHGLEIRFVVKGPLGAVQFVLGTGWLPRRTDPEGPVVFGHDVTTLPTDLGVHAKSPMYEDQEPMDDCLYTDGPCYYEGSTLNAEDAFVALVNGGIDGLWTFLETYYQCVFHDGEYPKSVEYMKPRRRKDSEE